ncbi:MAG: methyltransferase domain-containing protein [Deltaproteobacteria bacterium]|nr:methyltransferase domain-containing protein [Deltaproteobacteria bacterium]
MVFNDKTVKAYEQWLKSPIGYYIDVRRKKLVLDLLAPMEGERLLDVGCKTGNYMLFFRREGCDVTGLDSSPSMLSMARNKLGHRADFHVGNPEDLPFSDDEFDIVTLITCLDFADNSQKALEEAIRVSRKSVFVGFLNKYSFGAELSTIKEIFDVSPHSFSIWEMKQKIKAMLPSVSLRWGSVIFLPSGWYSFARNVEECIPSMNNPFGSFVGLTFSVVYTQRTLMDPVESSLNVGVTGGQHIPGTAKEMKQ